MGMFVNKAIIIMLSAIVCNSYARSHFDFVAPLFQIWPTQHTWRGSMQALDSKAQKKTTKKNYKKTTTKIRNISYLMATFLRLYQI